MCFNGDINYDAATLDPASKRQGLTLGNSPVAPETAAFKYRAFLSYSHADTASAKWLHRALEAYRIDKDLIGRETAHGPVPKVLRPIFRDRDDFSAGHSLTDQTVAALEASQFLIVICSPNAARSKYVNEEIRRFKALGRAARVIPVFVDGEPGNPQRECFTPAVCFRVDSDGLLTGEHEEPIAADARPHHDGKEFAKQKVVAGLLGVGLDEIMRRAARARKRRNLFRIGAAVAIVVLISLAGFGWWAMNLFSGKLSVAEDVNWVRDTADVCENAADTIAKNRISEGRRIALASECIDTFNQILSTLPRGTPVPMTVESSFQRYLTMSQTFRAEHKLSSQQLEVLSKDEFLAAQLGLV